MYFHLVYSPECFPVASGRNSTRKLFRQAIELMVTIDHEYYQNPTSSPFVFSFYPFHVGMSLPLGGRLRRGLCDTYGCTKRKFLSCANANSLYMSATR